MKKGCEYYPVGLRLEGERVLVAGGGAVAERKVRKLIEFGADVVLVSPLVTDTLAQLAQHGHLRWLERKVQPGDVNGSCLVFAATNDSDTNSEIVAIAHELSILANRADQAADCDFITPASFARGGVRVALFSGGAGPAMSRWLRCKLEAVIDEETAIFSEFFRQIREEILNLDIPQARRAELLAAILDSEVREVFFSEGPTPALDRAHQIVEHFRETCVTGVERDAS